MFKKHYQKRSPNIVIVLFRMVLSMVMFVVLVVGIYTAYKHFSGLDPLKLDPQAILSELMAGRVPTNFLNVLSSVKLTNGLAKQINQKVLGQQASKQVPSELSSLPKEATAAFKFLLVADSHTDNVDLHKAIDQAKNQVPDLKFIIGLGDYSDVGTVDELKNAKQEFDSSAIRYFVLAGDHDLWDSRNKQLPPTTNFNQVFGPVYQSFAYDNFLFLLLDDSDDYKGLGDTQPKWLEDELEKATGQPFKGIFVFLHEPLFHPSSDHVMGKTEPSLKQQARDLMYQLRSAGVKKIFAGDIHLSSEYNEPVTGLAMVTVGAVTVERNPQAPRYAVVSVFEDGKTLVNDIEIK